MDRTAEVARKTNETVIDVKLDVDGRGKTEISTGIPFFDHMLTLFGVHGFFDLYVYAKGDIEVDYHHTVEDVGLVLGDAFNQALADRRGIKRYGYAVTPMDETLATVAVDLSKRPFLVYNLPGSVSLSGDPFVALAKEFFRAFSTRGGMNLHINVAYGENEHHIVEAIYKAAGRSLDAACQLDPRVAGVLSSKGSL
ncbi:MAG: imidazoleglycerol-phosphate dehydratase HisB [Deltaproteobacteria bacterium]|jgi:imidazoleglycerol-phosphate dehydratase|nr:imidazoleglycerol-phosphate dehydratase HisB [Deltaproteobacteria bacterium]